MQALSMTTHSCLHVQKIYMQTRRAHFQSMKEVQGSFWALKCVHAVKKERKNIKGALWRDKGVRFRAFKVRSCTQWEIGCYGTLRRDEGTKLWESRPSSYANALKDKEGALVHVEGKAFKPSGYAHALKEGTIFRDKEVCSRWKIVFFGCSFLG